MNLIILGPAGSGKGTQAKLLAEKFKLKHLSSGRLLRQAAQEDSEQGRSSRGLPFEAKGASCHI